MCHHTQYQYIDYQKAINLHIIKSQNISVEQIDAMRFRNVSKRMILECTNEEVRMKNDDGLETDKNSNNLDSQG